MRDAKAVVPQRRATGQIYFCLAASYCGASRCAHSVSNVACESKVTNTKSVFTVCQRFMYCKANIHNRSYILNEIFIVYQRLLKS